MVIELKTQIWREESGENSTESLEKDRQQQKAFPTKTMSAVPCLSRNRIERGLLIPILRPPKDVWLDPRNASLTTQGPSLPVCAEASPGQEVPVCGVCGAAHSATLTGI